MLFIKIHNKGKLMQNISKMMTIISTSRKKMITNRTDLMMMIKMKTTTMIILAKSNKT